MQRPWGGGGGHTRASPGSPPHDPTSPHTCPSIPGSAAELSSRMTAFQAPGVATLFRTGHSVYSRHPSSPPLVPTGHLLPRFPYESPGHSVSTLPSPLPTFVCHVCSLELASWSATKHVTRRHTEGPTPSQAQHRAVTGKPRDEQAHCRQPRVPPSHRLPCGRGQNPRLGVRSCSCIADIEGHTTQAELQARDRAQDSGPSDEPRVKGSPDTAHTACPPAEMVNASRVGAGARGSPDPGFTR